MPPVVVFGADPGLASFGYAAVKLTATAESVSNVGVITTKKSDKKLKTLAADDNYQRTVALFMELAAFLGKYRFIAASAESMSYPRNASVSAKIGLAWGAFGSAVAMRGLPLTMASPQRIKKVLCGTVKASKQEVQEALLKRYPGAFDAFMEAYPKTLWEHGFDAVGSVVACLDSDVVKMARRMVG